MSVDWGQALQVGGMGFGLVFVVLSILALSMWLVGWMFNKYDIMKNTPRTNKKTISSNITGKNKTENIPEHKAKSKIDDFDRYE